MPRASVIRRPSSLPPVLVACTVHGRALEPFGEPTNFEREPLGVMHGRPMGRRRPRRERAIMRRGRGVVAEGAAQAARSDDFVHMAFPMFTTAAKRRCGFS